jgi:hypothetical protein
MKLKLLLCFILFIYISESKAQSYFNKKFEIKSFTYDNKTYKLYDFSRKGTSSTNIKAKYFATNAYSQYLKWKSGKKILLVTAGAFSDTWLSDATPVGLCVDNGVIVNKSPNKVMDGMVIVYNGAAQIGGIGVVDLDKKSIKCESPYGSGNYKYFTPRDKVSHITPFLNWGKKAGLTVFQTQLVYSEKKTEAENFSNLTYGNKRERRYLAICKKDGIVHHVVVDAKDEQYLMKGAKNVLKVLDYDGFEVLYIMNLDTGDKNILYTYNGISLYNHNPSSSTRAKIEKATNLLVYYKD